MATRFVPKAWIISTCNQPSQLCSTSFYPSWKRRWKGGWVSSRVWLYCAMFRSVDSKTGAGASKDRSAFIIRLFFTDCFILKSLQSFETSVFITNQKASRCYSLKSRKSLVVTDVATGAAADLVLWLGIILKTQLINHTKLFKSK
jgi:hypothetical protein